MYMYHSFSLPLQHVLQGNDPTIYCAPFSRCYFERQTIIIINNDRVTETLTMLPLSLFKHFLLVIWYQVPKIYKRIRARDTMAVLNGELRVQISSGTGTHHYFYFTSYPPTLDFLLQGNVKYC